MANEIKAGDVVHLKSSPKFPMTVKSTSKGSEYTTVTCVWINTTSQTVMERSFRLESLDVHEAKII